MGPREVSRAGTLPLPKRRKPGPGNSTSAASITVNRPKNPLTDLDGSSRVAVILVSISNVDTQLKGCCGDVCVRDFDEDSYNRLEGRIKSLLDNGVVRDRKHALIHMFMQHRLYAETEIIRESLTDGGNDCGIDAVYIDRRGDEPVVHLFQSKVFESLRKAQNPFPSSSLEKIPRFMQILNDRKLDLPKIANPRLEQKILEIRDSIDREFPGFKLWIISNGMPMLSEHAKPTIKLLERQSVRTEEFHLEEVVEFCLNRHSSRLNHYFFARDVGVIESGTTGLRSIVGYISGAELYKLLVDLRDERKIDYTLFNMNVRGFLGLDSPINREIFRSATSSENANFSSFNNGITIVGSHCKVVHGGQDGPKVGIKRLSIVNGAQTCSAIFDAMKDFYPNFSGFEKLSVLFRIFETEDPELIGRIALSTNNQNRINARDLRANSEEQVKLEVELRKHNVQYLRKRGVWSHEDEGLDTLDSLKAGQLLLSYVHLEPARAKRDSDSIFTEFYQKVFGAVDVEKLVEAFSWFKLIDHRRSFIEDEIRIRGVRRTENTFVTYGVFHILMLCGLLSGGKRNVDREQVIDKAISVIADKIKEAGEPAYYAYFRDPRQAEALRDAALQPELF